LEWIPAGKLQIGDLIYYPKTRVEPPTSLTVKQTGHFNSKPLPSTLALTPSFMEWLGYFAAEGFVSENSVNFANYEDAERIATLGQELFGLQGKITLKPYRSKLIRFHSRALSDWMETLVGRYAANKRLPEWVMGVNAECRHALLRSLLRSDGSFRQDKPGDASHSYRYGSASPTLSHQIMRLLLAEGIASTLEVAYPSPLNRQINGKPIRVNHPSYRVAVYDVVSVNRLLESTCEAPTYTETIVRQPYDSYPFADGWLYTLKSINRKPAKVTVYNLEVEEDHSYTTTTFTIHNCGCGTTIAAAQKLGRKWVGIDITHLSISLQKYRLKDSFDLEAGRDYQVTGEPEDVGSARHLFRQDPYQFQWWALSLIGAKPLGGEQGSKRGRKGADRGVDGIITFIEEKGKPARIMVQVKGGSVKSGDVRDLRGVLDRESAALGLFITLAPPTRDMPTEAVSAGFYESPLWQQSYPRLQILTIEELLAGKRPQMPPTGANVTFQKAARMKKEEGSQGKLW